MQDCPLKIGHPRALTIFTVDNFDVPLEEYEGCLALSIYLKVETRLCVRVEHFPT
jgi:hypothetical protein